MSLAGGGCGPGDASAFLRAEAEALAKPDGEGGVILAIVEDDGDAAAVASGLEFDGDPIPPDGRVRIASVTKVFTAVLVLQLAEEREVDLDAPVRNYVSDESLSRSVTVRHLLQHTSGLPDYSSLEGYAERVQQFPARALTPDEILEFVRNSPRLFEPGTGWSYSNTNYIYLGILIEEVTGEQVATVLRDRIFEPLALEDTYLAGFDDGAPVIETSWGGHDPSYPYTSVATGTWTSGGMVSSASDLAKFFSALFDGRLISDDSLEEMQAPAPGSRGNNPRSTYGLGLTQWEPTEYPGVALYGHGGGLTGTLILVFYEPETGTTYFAAGTDQNDFKPTMLEMIGYTQDH